MKILAARATWFDMLGHFDFKDHFATVQAVQLKLTHWLSQTRVQGLGHMSSQRAMSCCIGGLA